MCAGTMKEMTAPVLKHHLEQTGQAPFLLDVREPWEFDTVHIAGSKLIPLAELAQHLHELPHDRTIVAICHHGIRSRQAGLFLQAQGFTQTINLHGGIDSWAREVDPSLPLYN